MKCYTNITSNLYKCSQPEILECKSERGWLVALHSQSWPQHPRVASLGHDTRGRGLTSRRGGSQDGADFDFLNYPIEVSQQSCEDGGEVA